MRPFLLASFCSIVLSFSVTSAFAKSDDSVNMMPVTPTKKGELFLSCPSGNTTVLVFGGDDVIQSFNFSGSKKDWDVFKPKAGNSIFMIQHGQKDALVIAKTQHHVYKIYTKAAKALASAGYCYFKIPETGPLSP